MPLALPPAIPPELADAATLATRHDVVVDVPLGRFRLHVLGAAAGVDRDDLTAAIRPSPNLSEAIYNVRAWFYSHGWPGTRTHFAQAGDDVWVLVERDGVVRVDMPAPFRAYFAPLEGRRQPVTDDAIEPARTLASLHADRARTEAQLRWTPEADGLVLGVAQEPTGASPVKFTAGVGNPGNRFIGRYFADYGATLSLASGDEFSASGRNVLRGIDDSHRDGRYGDYGLAWSRVTSLGVVSLAGQALRYDQTVELPEFPDPLDVDGRVRRVEAGWSAIASAGFDHRVGLGVRADYVDRRLRAQSQTVEQQRYPSVELGTEFTKAVHLGGRGFQFGGGLALRKGLDHDGTHDLDVMADLGYFLVRPSLRIERPRDEGWGASFAVSGQWTLDVTPEQQQWVGGGKDNLEAFLPGTLIGDDGWLARLQFDLGDHGAHGLTLTPHAFAEYGGAKLHEAFAADTRSRALADAGVSLSLKWRQWLAASVAWAFPVAHHGFTHDEVHDARADVVFRVEARFP